MGAHLSVGDRPWCEAMELRSPAAVRKNFRSGLKLQKWCSFEIDDKGDMEAATYALAAYSHRF